jgi:hypothetical protein
VLSTQADVNNQTVSVNPGIYSWTTGSLAWSPDGRYLIDAFSLLGILHPAGAPSPTAAGLNAVGWEGAPNLSIRDPALQGLLASLSANASHREQLQDDIAWSPDGRILAAIPESNASNSSDTTSGKPASVTFYDSSTGRSLGTLEPQPNSQVSATPIIGSSSFLRWSTSGSHVLLFSAQLATITIWGPSMLPKSTSR